jgi:hypothetical protein
MCLLSIYVQDVISPAPGSLCFHHRYSYKTDLPVVKSLKMRWPICDSYMLTGTLQLVAFMRTGAYRLKKVGLPFKA